MRNEEHNRVGSVECLQSFPVDRSEWLNRKVENARAQIAAGQFYSNETMKERVATKRAHLLSGRDI